MATYYIKKDSKNQYFWILESDKNGKTVSMSSESYISEQGVKNSIAWNQTNANSKNVIDLT